jgi:hypothetical protein
LVIDAAIGAALTAGGWLEWQQEHEEQRVVFEQILGRRAAAEEATFVDLTVFPAVSVFTIEQNLRASGSGEPFGRAAANDAAQRGGFVARAIQFQLAVF